MSNTTVTISKELGKQLSKLAKEKGLVKQSMVEKMLREGIKNEREK